MPRKTVKTGVAYLVGAGPGELQLLTLRAREVLGQADVVVYDFLANERLLAWAPGAKTVYVGKRSGKHTLSQEEINALLVREVARGKRVVRLKGGDPFLFGRGGEEGRALHEAGLAFEVVPGVTSALAVPAYAGIPVTERNTSATVGIVTGHEHTDKDESSVPFDALAKLGTVVMLMGVKNMRANFDKLVAHGMPRRTPAAVVQWGTVARQRTVTGTLADLPERAAEGVSSPAVIVVGEVVKLRAHLNWFESRPWFGKRIVVTRSKEAAGDFVDVMEQRGAEVRIVPSIAFAGPASYDALDRGIAKLARYDWVVFTSVNGVEYFWRRLLSKGKDARAFGPARIAVVGPVTGKALEQVGLRPDAMPKEFRGAKLAEALGGKKLKGKRILLVRAEEGSEEFPAAARELGAKVDLAPAYRTVAAKRPKGFRPVDEDGRMAELHVFASPSAVRSFQKMLKPAERAALRDAPAACIGPVTAEAARAAGYRVVVLPERSTAAGLIAAIDSYFRGSHATA